MKKYVLILFAALSALNLSAANISIPSLYARPDSTLQVPVNIDDATGVGGYNFTLTYDASVLTATGTSAGSLTQGWMTTSNINIPGQVTVSGLDSTLTGLAGGSGSLVNINFTVAGEVNDATGLNFTGNNKINDVNALNLPAVFQNGSFQVTGYSIEGRVSLAGGGDVTACSLSISGGTSLNVHPDSSGLYSFSNLPPGDYTVAITLAGYAFSPPSRNYLSLSSDISGADYNGSLAASVAGTISYPGGSSGTIRTGLYPSADFTGDALFSTGIGSPGNYLLSNIPSDSYHVAAYMDVNGNGSWDQENEPFGAYPSNPVILSPGQALSGVNISLKEPLILTVVSSYGNSTPAAGLHPYYTGDSVSASAPEIYGEEGGTRYSCTGWTGTGDVSASGAGLSTSFVMTQDSSITWNWKTQYILSPGVSPAGGGTIELYKEGSPPAPAGEWYDAGTAVDIKAVAFEGYFFDRWTGDGVPAGQERLNPLPVTVTGALSITAVFISESQELTVAPLSASFTFNLSEPGVPVRKDAVINISNTGEAGALNWTAGPVSYNKGSNWITLDPLSGSLQPGSSENMTLTVDRTGMNIGAYTATVPVSSNGGSKDIQVTVNITTNDKVVSIPDISASPGSSFQAPVNIDNAQGVGGCGLKISYNPAILSVSGVSSGTLTGDGWIITPNINIPGEIVVNIVHGSLQEMPAGPGSLLTISFNAIGAPGDSCSISFSETILITPTTSVIPSVSVPGTFATSGYTLAGKVTLQGGTSNAEGTLLTLSGSQAASTSPGSQGNYIFPDVMPGVFTVTPSLAGYRFEPASRSYQDINSHLASQDFTGIFQCVLTVASQHGEPVPAPGDHVYDYNTQVNLSVSSPVSSTEGTRYVSTGWTGSGNIPVSGSSTSLSTALTVNSSITWNWKTQYRLDTAVEGSGVIIPIPQAEGGWYDGGAQVALTAQAADGWFFAGWDGDASGSQSTVQVDMNGPRAVTAIFTKKSFLLHPQTDIIPVVLDDDTSHETLIAVGVEYVGDFQETISLASSVLPATGRVTAEVLPSTVANPDEVFLLDIGISADTRPETYMVTVRGEGGDESRTAQVAVIVHTKLYIPPIIFKPGDSTVSIPVRLTSGEGLAEFSFVLEYDPLLFDMSQAGASLLPGSLNPEGWILDADSSIPGQLLVEGAGPAVGTSGDGSIIVIKAAAAGGDYPDEGSLLSASGINLLSDKGLGIPYVSRAGLSYLMEGGDINSDEDVNIIDVVLCLRMSIGLDVEVKGSQYVPAYPAWIILRGDMNGDGEVDISDVVLTLRKSVGLN